MKTASLKEILSLAKQRLSNDFEAEVLVAHALGKDRGFLYAHSSDVPSTEELNAIHHLIKQRQLGVPVAYLLGHKEFYGRPFIVNAHVLIPRPETELIIDHVLTLPLPKHAKVLDVGTGSGCIGLTLAIEQPQWVVCVSDLSAEALEVCQQNRQALNLTNVVVYQGHLLDPMGDQTFDLIVANLPYIAPNDPHLTQGDLPQEPTMALVAENQGYSLIDILIAQAPNHLNRPGHLVLEHGFEQQAHIEATLANHGFVDVVGHRDLAGHPRMVTARLKDY